MITVDIKFSHYWSLRINPHIDLVTLNVFTLDGDSSYSTQSKSQNHQKHLCMTGSTHLHFPLNCFPQAKTSEASIMLTHPSGWKQTRKHWTEFQSAKDTVLQTKHGLSSPLLTWQQGSWVNSLHVGLTAFILNNMGRKRLKFQNPTPYRKPPN